MIALILRFSPNSIALLANYVTVVEYERIDLYYICLYSMANKFDFDLI